MSELPFSLAIAPFPEGFQGDMDETFQQAYANTTATVQGNFLTGLILPPGSTLPTNDQGPIAMNETWYFWDTATNQYIPQATTQKGVRNYVRNSSYWVVQNVLPTTIPGSGGGIATPLFDMTHWVGTQGTVVQTVSQVSGPLASGDNDIIPNAIQYTSGPTIPTIGIADYFVHEHMVEGMDICSLQGQVLSLSLSIYTQVAGTYSVYLLNNGQDASYVTNVTLPANVWTRVKIAGIPAFPSFGTWSYGEGQTGLYIGVCLALGNQWKTANLNQWVSGHYLGSNQNMNFLAVAGKTIAITGIKLEPAVAPTYYQCPSFIDEYENVIRYFFTTFNYQSLTAGAGIMGSCQVAANGYLAFVFPRRMCRQPLVTPYSTASPFNSANIRNVSTGADVALAAFTAASPKGLNMGIAVAGAAKADVLSLFIRADARLT